METDKGEFTLACHTAQPAAIPRQYSGKGWINCDSNGFDRWLAHKEMDLTKTPSSSIPEMGVGFKLATGLQLSDPEIEHCRSSEKIDHIETLCPLSTI